MTASTPRSLPSSSRMTGTPPPPAQTTTAPEFSSRRTTRVSTIRPGLGDGTTRRQYGPSGFTAPAPLRA